MGITLDRCRPEECAPQNTYKRGQLYAAGALRVSCAGLQCIGFNNEVYHTVLEQSQFAHCTPAVDGLLQSYPVVDVMQAMMTASLRLTGRFSPLRDYCAWALYLGRLLDIFFRVTLPASSLYYCSCIPTKCVVYVALAYRVGQSDTQAQRLMY